MANKIMKKKILTLTSCMLLTVGMLTGCGEETTSIKQLPKVHIQYWTNDGDTERSVEVGEEFEFDKYEKVDTDDGCTVTIHFRKAKKD